MPVDKAKLNSRIMTVKVPPTWFDALDSYSRKQGSTISVEVRKCLYKFAQEKGIELTA